MLTIYFLLAGDYNLNTLLHSAQQPISLPQQCCSGTLLQKLSSKFACSASNKICTNPLQNCSGSNLLIYSLLSLFL